MLEARLKQPGPVVVDQDGSGDAANPERHAFPYRIGHFAAGDDIGNGKAATGLEHAEGFAENAFLVGGEVNDTVGDDDVD